jgi:hypothetical protein
VIGGHTKLGFVVCSVMALLGFYQRTAGRELMHSCGCFGSLAAPNILRTCFLLGMLATCGVGLFSRGGSRSARQAWATRGIPWGLGCLPLSCALVHTFMRRDSLLASLSVIMTAVDDVVIVADNDCEMLRLRLSDPGFPTVFGWEGEGRSRLGPGDVMVIR